MPGTKLGWWLNDFRWAMNLIQARRWRRQLFYSQRVRFDRALRPRMPQRGITDDPPPSDEAIVTIGEPVILDVIAYPDALYRITADDVLRAMGETSIHFRWPK